MKSESGFGLVETLLVILILLVAGFGGYAVWRNEHKANSATSSSASSTTSGSKASTNSNAQSGLNPVQSAYTAYINAASKTPIGDTKAAIKPYVTTDVYNAIVGFNGGYDPVLCAQAAPSSFSAKVGSSSDSSKAIVNVNEVFGSDTASPVVTVDLSSLKISDISCFGYSVLTKPASNGPQN